MDSILNLQPIHSYEFNAMALCSSISTICMQPSLNGPEILSHWSEKKKLTTIKLYIDKSSSRIVYSSYVLDRKYYDESRQVYSNCYYLKTHKRKHIHAIRIHKHTL